MVIPEGAQVNIATHVANWVEIHLKQLWGVPAGAAKAAGIAAGNKAAQIAELTVRENT